MLEFEEVCKVYQEPDGSELRALNSVSLRVPEGEVHCLIGTSGCGKTTALRMFNRLNVPSAGVVRVGGADVRSLDIYSLRRRIGYVIQSGGLFPHMSVRDNLALPGVLEGWSSERSAERVHEVLTLVSLDPSVFAARMPSSLSGGQRQRVGVARALVLDPDYLLMDEPFGALDPITRKGLRRELSALWSGAKKTVLLVTHDLEEAFALGDRISVMHAGDLIQTGSPEEIRQQPSTEFVAQLIEAS